jgi:hypothetical protein
VGTERPECRFCLGKIMEGGDVMLLNNQTELVTGRFNIKSEIKKKKKTVNFGVNRFVFSVKKNGLNLAG